MLCPRCHTENREDRRFCSKCAAPLAVVCASCGFTNDPGDEFCGGCAQSLRAGPRRRSWVHFCEELPWRHDPERQPGAPIHPASEVRHVARHEVGGVGGDRRREDWPIL